MKKMGDVIGNKQTKRGGARNATVAAPPLVTDAGKFGCVLSCISPAVAPQSKRAVKHQSNSRKQCDFEEAIASYACRRMHSESSSMRVRKKHARNPGVRTCMRMLV